MDDSVQFETPENVTVSYSLAGPGTRFVAFFFDEVILFVVFVVLCVGIGALVALFSAIGTMGFLGEDLGELGAALVVAGFILLLSFIQLAYFAGCEWFMNGQTLGKRAVNIRVVMENGFSLTVTGILVRNIMRLLDTFPLLWVVPVVTQKRQRFGDMVAGTIVVSEGMNPLSVVRERLGSRPPRENRFTFSPAQLDKVDPRNLEAVEMFLARRSGLAQRYRQDMARQLASAIIDRIECDPVNDPADQERFLEDLIAASVRRDVRELG